MDTMIKETILAGTRVNSMLEINSVTVRASQEDMESFYKDIDELYDEPVFEPLPSAFYKP